MNDFGSEQKQTFIRADGNAIIGFGHLMRALAFATHAKRLTHVKLLIRNPDRIAIEACNHYAIPFDDISSIPESEEAHILGGLAGKGNIVFLDGYGFEEAYQQTIKRYGCFLVCMDDHHERFFYADCIINVAEISRPSDVRRLMGSRLVFGLKYALVRPEFSISEINPQRKNQLFVCFGGGTETLPLLYKTIDAISISKLSFDRILIILNEKLVESVHEYHHSKYTDLNIMVMSNVSSVLMAEIMKESSLGITSSSTVSLEARALGLPIVAGYYVDNQMGIYESLLKNHEIEELGSLIEISVERLSDKLIRKYNLKNAFKGVVDSSQIKKNYAELIQSWVLEIDFSIRFTSDNDRKNILNLTDNHHLHNDFFSEFYQSEKSLDELQEEEKKKKKQFFSGIWKDNLTGVVAFHYLDNRCRIDYLIHPEYKNHGFDEMMIRKGMQKCIDEEKSNFIFYAEVPIQDAESLRVYRNLYFEEKSEADFFIFTFHGDVIPGTI